ncbi:hypothetical protein OKW45_006634 [Paraburkholderia sp. WSM4175]|uniref:hypothetical protein n=1 Tax=Paraburkholderia sp. WSM4175 TaxID=2991072 RepID=UPI003D214EDF
MRAAALVREILLKNFCEFYAEIFAAIGVYRLDMSLSLRNWRDRQCGGTVALVFASSRRSLPLFVRVCHSVFMRLAGAYLGIIGQNLLRADVYI